MMNFVPTWLLLAQVLVISTAQDVGTFLHETPLFKMFYAVNEEHEATLTVVVPSVLVTRGDKTFEAYFNRGPNPLRKVEDFTYTVDFDSSESASDDWHEALETFLVNTGVLESDETYSPDDTQPRPLTTLTYTSGDEFSVNFRGEEILFLRLGRNLVPGEYVYKESVAPYLRISYTIRVDRVGGVLVECKRRSTSRFGHMLVRRDRGLQYIYHVVESAGRGTLDQFLDQVKYVCPGKRVLPDDFSRVVVATEKTIYVEFEGGRLALTKV
ncbi:hypothetical protein FOZ63_029685 [Perkinsus olseni]|uniref:Uncharacterized protein n=1 Tax=Perkinsus olseni TaxID=32597 RepID=A0A7J6NI13_PEROL|nr:hypothetical protein FOZ60_008993 [Perkinsus olseni]KAF4699142.1 hypothetical protein FOZ63_029685 [Perkinsus olseni]